MDNRESEDGRLVQKVLWWVTTAAIAGVIALGRFIANDMKADIEYNGTEVRLVREEHRLVREEQIRRAARIQELENKTMKLQAMLDWYVRQMEVYTGVDPEDTKAQVKPPFVR